MTEENKIELSKGMPKAEALVNQFIDLLGEYEFTRPTDMVIMKLQEALMWANSAMQEKNRKQIIQKAI